MVKPNPKVPLGLPLTAVVLLVLGYFAGPFIQSQYSEEELARNVLLNAIPFILVFVAILLFFISLIWFVASKLHHTISARYYRPIEYILIAGMVLGIVGMFQPWVFAFYKYGFTLLFVSLLSFILWSHIRPRVEG
jgi:heme/copper-type cytochrome/quinol oxidase subunit 2